MTHFGMAIDLARCVGCNACVVACKQCNNVPEGIFWNRVLTEGGDAPFTAGGQWPDNHLKFAPLSCQHCENPACVKVCPVGATFKDLDTGVVRQDWDRCIGCRMCIAACPYTGVRSFNWQEPSYAIGHATGDASVSQHQKHTVEKCTFCYQRTSQGEDPACMVFCPAHARIWGDLDDPQSEISQTIAKREYENLLPEHGTRPSVYYLL